MQKMTRQQAITDAARAVAEAANYSLVGKNDFFGEVTAENITSSVSSAVDNLSRILAMTDLAWDTMWAASTAETDRVEMDAAKFAAGRS